jgi:hypothetical protein
MALDIFIMPAILAGGVGQGLSKVDLDTRTGTLIYEPFAGCYLDSHPRK